MPNCTNCGGVLPPNSGVCTYCDTRNDVDLHHVHEFTKVEHNEERVCPHCSIELVTINIKSEDNFFIEQCEECKGLFFDPNELEALLDASVSNAFIINYKRIETINRELSPDKHDVKYLKCPVCRQFMHRKSFASSSGVVIDTCRDHGSWMDSGKFKRLTEWKKSGGQLLHVQRELEIKNSESKLSKNLEAHEFLGNPGSYDINLVQERTLNEILFFVIPPYAVFKKEGMGISLVLSFLLIWFGYFPALIHALWIHDKIKFSRE